LAIAHMAPEDPWIEIRCSIAENIRRALRLYRPHDVPDPARIPDIARSAREELEKRSLPIPDEDLERLTRDVVDEVCGLGPIQELLRDPSVSEIMVNGPRKVYCERQGHLELTNKVFRDGKHIREIIERIMVPLGRMPDIAHPMADGRLADGSRVNAVIPPVAIDGPTLTIRKFSRERITAPQLVSYGSISHDAISYWAACVQARLSVVVSGGTGSGKTTLLNVLSSFVPTTERLITIEDTAELQLQQPHVVRMEAVDEEKVDSRVVREAVTIRELVRNALRMRPDRIIIGEVRGAEVIDLLQALNTGHDGSMTTLHANSAIDALFRLESMALLAGNDLSISTVANMIARTVNVVVQTARLSSGRRAVVEIAEIAGRENGQYLLNTLFQLEEGPSSNRRIVATGAKTRFGPRFQQAGFSLSRLDSIFNPPDV
jgi:pilus assembly protein CpaF